MKCEVGLTDKEVGKDKGRGPSAIFRRGLGLGLTKRLETRLDLGL